MPPRIRISLPTQTLDLRDERGNLLRRYPVSTALNGAGELAGSHCTPRGRHLVRARIGAEMPVNTVFRGRRPTGELWTPQLAQEHPDRDWILTRILWLSGTEPGRNRLGQHDTMRRYIYLHGAPDEAPIGAPGSHGCVRMRNADIIELFDLVPAYARVDIDDFGIESGSWEGLGEAAHAVREAVFVVEQGVPRELELDANDAPSRHVLARDAQRTAIGTGRLLPDGHIGRMAVLPGWRGQGVGRALLELLLDEAGALGMAALVLNAQVQACGFYRRFGFVEVGDEFFEAGLPHRAMRRQA
jgi:predicted GNAT family N-acyltransferase